MHHIVVYNPSNQVCHNCILIIYAFSKVCTIVLQLLYNLPINQNFCFLIIASKLNIFTISCIHTIGIITPWQPNNSPICIIESYTQFVPCPKIAAVKRRTKTPKSIYN